MQKEIEFFQKAALHQKDGTSELRLASAYNNLAVIQFTEHKSNQMKLIRAKDLKTGDSIAEDLIKLAE